MGVVVRDHEGHVVFAATRRIKAFWPPEIAKAKALAMTAKLGKRHGFEEVILESNCQNLINRLSKGAIFLADLDIVLGDIMSVCPFYKSVSWSHVKKNGNSVAHHLAKLVSFGVQQVWENYCPQEIYSHVLMDVLSLNL